MLEIQEQVDMSEPLHQEHHVCREANTPDFGFLERAMSCDGTVIPLEEVINEIRENTLRTKMNTYVTELNSPVTKHKIHEKKTYPRL